MSVHPTDRGDEAARVADLPRDPRYETRCGFGPAIDRGCSRRT